MTYRQINVQNLLQISHYLHQAEYRARYRVRTSVKDALDVDAARRVCSSFDFAGLFVHRGLVDRKVFLDHWGSLLCFLRDHLSQCLDETAFGAVTAREYYQYFDWLIEEAAKRPNRKPLAERALR